MQNVRKLRAKGFTVTQATKAVDCTEVSSSEPFFYYNPKFATTPDDVYRALKAVEETDGKYQLIIAGNCPPDDGEIPLSVVTIYEVDAASTLFHRIEAARQALREQEAEFNKNMQNIMSA